MVAHIQLMDTPRYGDSARSTHEMEPIQVRVLSHQILIILLSAITPNDGAHIATSRAPTITAAENIHQRSTLSREFLLKFHLPQQINMRTKRGKLQ